MWSMCAPVDPAAMAARARSVAALGTLCGLPVTTSAARCERAWCSHFDGEKKTCALLVWDVPGRLGPDALRWFVTHRAAIGLPEIETLHARVGSL